MTEIDPEKLAKRRKFNKRVLIWLGIPAALLFLVGFIGSMTEDKKPEPKTTSTATSVAASASTTATSERQHPAQLNSSQMDDLYTEVVGLASKWQNASAGEVADLGSKACDKLLGGGSLEDAINEVFVNTGRMDALSQDDTEAVKTLVIRSIPAMCPSASAKVG